MFQDVSDHEVVCLEQREQSGGSSRGGSKEVVRPQQGPEDKIWEAKRSKVGTGVGALARTETQRELQRGRPEARMFNDPGTGVHINPKQTMRTGLKWPKVASWRRWVGRDEPGACMRCPLLLSAPGEIAENTAGQVSPVGGLRFC